MADSSCCGGEDRTRVEVEEEEEVEEEDEEEKEEVEEEDEEEDEEEEEEELRKGEESWQPPGNPAAAVVWPAKAKPAATIRLISSAAWKWTAA